MTYSIANQYPVFTDSDGTPLEDGYVYFGVENQNPAISPIDVFWDSDLSLSVAQPIRTLAGSPNRNGQPSPIYSASAYSILIKDKRGRQIYYNGSGAKSFTTDYIYSNRNALINGDFALGRSVYNKWSRFQSGYDIEVDYASPFDPGQIEVPGNPSYFMKIGQPLAFSSGASDYVRYSQAIENVYNFAGETVSLSFYAKHVGIERIAISLTQNFNGADTNVTGIGATIINLTNNWQKYSLTIDIPSIYGKTIYPYPAGEHSLIFNLWVAAGSDFDNETNGLGHLPAVGGVFCYIADIQIESGPVASSFDRKQISETIQLVNRYFEWSYGNMTTDIPAIAVDGYLSFIAPGAATVIPGFMFRNAKRSSSPTVTLYSANNGASNAVYRDGVGNVTVSSCNNVTAFGVGSITLAAPTVANNLYKFHYVVQDDLII